MTVALIIGSGRMARIRMASILARDDVVRCVVVTSSPDRAREFAGNPVEVIDRSRLAEIERPDLVFVASATARHAADARSVMRFGCPILCEKPLAESNVDARALLNAAAANSVPLYVGFQRHFDPSFREIQERLASDTFGVLYHLRFTHFDHVPGSRQFIAESGGIFADMLVHDIECALWLTGKRVRSVFASGSVRALSDYADFGDCDNAVALLTLDDGLTVTLHATRQNPFGQDVRVEANGSKSAIAVGLTPATPIEAAEVPALFNHNPPQSFEQRFAKALASETNEFVDFAVGASESFRGASAAVAAEAVEIAQACQRSHECQRLIELTDLEA